MKIGLSFIMPSMNGEMRIARHEKIKCPGFVRPKMLRVKCLPFLKVTTTLLDLFSLSSLLHFSHRKQMHSQPIHPKHKLQEEGFILIVIPLQKSCFFVVPITSTRWVRSTIKLFAQSTLSCAAVDKSQQNQIF